MAAPTIYRSDASEAEGYLQDAAAQEASLVRLAALIPVGEISPQLLDAAAWSRKRFIERLRFAALLAGHLP